jgi:hypothetical protein
MNNQSQGAAPSLQLLTVFYGGMVTLAGVLGAKREVRMRHHLDQRLKKSA